MLKICSVSMSFESVQNVINKSAKFYIRRLYLVAPALVAIMIVCQQYVSISSKNMHWNKMLNLTPVFYLVFHILSLKEMLAELSNTIMRKSDRLFRFA